MSVPRILLMGYYGKGNFGDDVLLQVSYSLLKRIFPDAAMSIIIDGHHGGYITSMLGDVEVLAPGRHGHFDIIVHGGGGVFFDFKQYGRCSRLGEYALRLIGFSTFVSGERILRTLLNKHATSANCRLGFGIGVGTFSTGSPRMRASLPRLADFDALWVRDTESVANLKRFHHILGATIIQGSDLAFLTEYWLPTGIPTKPTASRPRLGILLRDWPEELGGMADSVLRQTLATLAMEYEITGFILDRHADLKLQKQFAGYALCIWQPERMTIAEFSAQLAMQDVVLTSRAHGAICSACLGVPSVIIGIEPKLAQVAAMLPNASCFVAADEVDAWPAMIRRALAIDTPSIARDVVANRSASEAALLEIERWLS